ncbi:MAG: T9SS type A sorting domain-containing protein [Calditrichaeota bacterium]|nr:T9SS type A sorting domain-containing protein [Calditrichota bacterium]
MKQLPRLLPGICFAFLGGVAFAAHDAPPGTTVTCSEQPGNAAHIAFRFDLPALEAALASGSDSASLIPGEGSLAHAGMPLLPAVSRYVILPPDREVDLIVQADGYQRRNATALPTGEDYDPDATLPPDHLISPSNLYPPEVASLTDISVMRGVRLGLLTVYPLQVDLTTGEVLLRKSIEVHLTPSDRAAAIPIEFPLRTGRSAIFRKLIAGFALGGDRVGRDDPDAGALPASPGHYLVVLPSVLLPSVGPFIETRRKEGYRVDILGLTQNAALTAATVKAGIQGRYDAFLRAGADPFDLVMLVGDHSRYTAGPAAQTVLATFRGTPTDGSPEHADYEYGLLEGGNNDRYADVGVARWCAGSAEKIDLFWRRHRAYASNPPMNEDWFSRGAVYAQRWANDWHVSIPTTVRWGEEMVKAAGLTDVRFYENIGNLDRDGSQVGNFCVQQMNSHLNVMLGRAQNRLFGADLRPANRTVFPIVMELGGHHEGPTWALLRNPTVQNISGPCAAATYNGVSSTRSANVTWMEMTRALLIDRLPFGWARVIGVTKPVAYMGNLYPASTMQTDVQFYGDPGLIAWTGRPIEVEIDLPVFVSPDIRSLDLTVMSGEREISGALVSLYMPGRIPAFNSNDYATYDDMQTLLARTDEHGRAQFTFDGLELIAGTPLYVTCTGPGIKPLYEECWIEAPDSGAELTGYEVEELEGNGDGLPNPGETLRLALTVANRSPDESLRDLDAILVSRSPHLEIVGDDRIVFGDIDPESDAAAAVDVRLAITAPDGISRPALKPELVVFLRSGDQEWPTTLKIVPRAPHLIFRSIVGGASIRDTLTYLTIELANIGSAASPPMIGQLVSLGQPVEVVSGEVRYPAAEPGEVVRPDGERALVAGSRFVPAEAKCGMRLDLASESGITDTAWFELAVVRPEAGAPVGPDAYGYVCFDDTDQEWEQRPGYAFFEIDPREQNFNARGTAVNFQGNIDIGEARLVDLPFSTRFYGQSFDQITVSTNGFIVMGEHPRATGGTNWPLDRAIGGAPGMVAPFWDNLTLGNGRIYTYYDEDQGRFIIEWSRVRHLEGNSDLSFQVILYDVEVWWGHTVDQPILFQYKAIQNVAGNGQFETPFASVGISPPDGGPGLNYSWNNRQARGGVPLQNRRALYFTTMLRIREAVLYGRVTSRASGEGIENAILRTSFNQSAISDADGYWFVNQAIAAQEFTLTCTAEGFNDSTMTELEVPEDDSLECNFSLLNPVVHLSPERLEVELNQGQIRDYSLTLRNEGTGPLWWRSSIDYPGDSDAAALTVRDSISAAVILEDNDLGGVLFINDHFYVSGMAGNRPNQIYILNREGVYVSSFQQPGNSLEGMKNLTWDGEWIWGGAGSIGDRHVYGFTPDGELMRTIEGPWNPNSIVIWDSDRNCLWLGNRTQALSAYDREGRSLGWQIPRRDLRIYGAAYFADDPDDFPFYIFHSAVLFQLEVYKSNPAGDQIRLGPVPSRAATVPGGMFITREWDPFSWVIVSMVEVSSVNGGDRIEVLQAAPIGDWIAVDPVEGELSAGAETNLTFSLDANDLPEGEFACEIDLKHNAWGGESVVPIEVRVMPDRRPRGFSLLEPPDGDTLTAPPRIGDPPPPPEVMFAWRASRDPDPADTLRYLFRIASGGAEFIGETRDTTLTLGIDTLGLGNLFTAPIFWWVEAIGGQDTTPSIRHFRFHLRPDRVADDLLQPGRFALEAPYPNPFNARATVAFSLERPSVATLLLYDMRGRQVVRLGQGEWGAGKHYLTIDAEGLPGGLYFLQLRAGESVVRRKVVVVR